MKPRPSCDQTPAWRKLREHHAAFARTFDLRDAFAADAERFAHFSQEAPHVFADLSKCLIDRQAERLLFELARERGLQSWRDAMFAGEAINQSEGRAVLHTLLRAPKAQAAPVTHDLLVTQRVQVHASLDAMLAFAEQVRGDASITDIVNIGIGGSDLGPHMAVLALASHASKARRLHFVSNVDGHELDGVLQGLKPESTLFLVASKTFTTTETMTNAQSARRWFLDRGGTDMARHFVALSTNIEAANAFGIQTCFGFWVWVGGRYSIWSAIGLPIAIAIGAQGFRDLLAGAHAMDQHFQSADLERNLPVRLGLLDVWQRNFLGCASRCIAPYHSGLRRLPAYLQQLEMESNGKRVDQAGTPISFATAPVLWGEPGTNGQHAFFQMLHQGTELVPVEFIAVKLAAHALEGHQEKLLANALAQAQALMLGRSDAGGHRDFPGNRPSLFFILEQLDPRTLGALIALYEHRVFVSGAIWGVNSFDQWGVELGKSLAKDLEPRLASGDVQGLDPSSAGLLRRLRSASPD